VESATAQQADDDVLAVSIAVPQLVTTDFPQAAEAGTAQPPVARTSRYMSFSMDVFVHLGQYVIVILYHIISWTLNDRTFSKLEHKSLS